MGPPLTVIGPSSLTSWYGQFARTHTNVLFVGEEGSNLDVLTDRILRAADEVGSVRMLSGHDSLLRDWILSSRLRARGIGVVSQSGFATAFGLDKVLQKRLLQATNVRIPDWGIDPPSRGSAGSIWKGRTGTQSRSISWDRQAIGDESFWEAFQPGDEYSVVAYSDDGGIVTFPAVWKGPVTHDLVPPWKRLRTIPGPIDDASAEELDNIARAIARVIDNTGFMEVEFIISPEGAIFVTEVNPRICGTLRMCAMATELHIFDPEALGGSHFGALKPTLFVAEVPYAGQSMVSRDAIATSRLTVAGESPAMVVSKMESLTHTSGAWRWPEGWE